MNQRFIIRDELLTATVIN